MVFSVKKCKMIKRFSGNSFNSLTDLNKYLSDYLLSEKYREELKKCKVDQEYPDQYEYISSFFGKKPLAMVSPHAGYIYSGLTASTGWLIANKVREQIKTVFILGPAHYAELYGFGLSPYSTWQYENTLFRLDLEIYSELFLKKELFKKLHESECSIEHSLEIHLPFISTFLDPNVKIVPIMVGFLDEKTSKSFGSLFLKYLTAPDSITVISTDFCHWGKNFSYYHYETSSSLKKKDISQGIKNLDQNAFNAILSFNPQRFIEYLSETENTICGKYPIIAFLETLSLLDKNQFELKKLFYDQSNIVSNNKDSSVSYLSAALFQK